MAKHSLPEIVRIGITPNAKDCFVEDVLTGERLDDVKAIDLHVDADSGMTQITVTFCPVRAVITGEPKYIFAEEHLQKIAADNGFDIVKLPQPVVR